jgi:hypothetical protein
LARVLVLGRPAADVEALREDIGMWFAPLASGLAMVVTGLMLFWLGAGPTDAILLALFSRLWFANVVFGAIPDLWGIVAVPMCALLALFIRAVRDQDGGHLGWWCALTTVATGITITNLGVGIALLGLAGLLARLPIRELARRSAIVAGMAIAVNAVAFVGASSLYGFPLLENEQWERKYMVEPEVEYVTARLPMALAGTVAPGEVRTIPNAIGIQNRERFEWAFSLEPSPGDRARPGLLGWAILGWFLVALGMGIRLRGPYRRILAGAATVLLINAAIHLRLGRELILYSEHWASALLVVLALPILRVASPALRRGLILGAMGVVALANAAHLGDMLRMLAAGG